MKAHSLLSKLSLKEGAVFTNQELMDTFGVANSGGMRRSLENNVLILIHDIRQSIYQDKWVNGELHYTGMGLKGDQKEDFAQNRTLKESKTNGVNVLLFELKETNQYTFRAEVILSREPYKSKQKDINGKLREVIIFPLKMKV